LVEMTRCCPDRLVTRADFIEKLSVYDMKHILAIVNKAFLTYSLFCVVCCVYG
jgi:hypothetical protein